MTKAELKKNITKINKLLRSDSYEAGIELIKTLDDPEIKKGTAKIVTAVIKKLLKQRDYEAIDTGIELARALDEPTVFETLLEGCSIDKEGKLVRNKIFSGTGPAQPFLDYALVNLILFSPGFPKMDESLKHSNITKLYLVKYGDFSFLPEGLSQIPNLASLDLNNCSSLQNVDGLTNLTNLTSLNLGSCYSLQNVDGLVNLSNLASLSLSFWLHLESLPDVLVNLPNLSILDLTDCESLQNVDGLTNLPNLTSLILGSCNSLQNVDGLANCTKLTSLDLSSCRSLQNVDGLANCTKLTSLDLGSCGSLQNVDGLANLPNLTNLDLSWCDKVQPKPSVPEENMYGQPEMTTCKEVVTYQTEIKKSIIQYNLWKQK